MPTPIRLSFAAFVVAWTLGCTGSTDVATPTAPLPPATVDPAHTTEPQVVIGVTNTDGSPLILDGSVSGPAPPPVAFDRKRCTELADGGPLLEGSDALTGVLHCGDTLVGHTRGGVLRYDTAFYEHSFCTPATTTHDGGDERIYKLELPDPQTRALVWLDTPCADLDLAALHGGDAPPTAVSQVKRCEMNIKPETGRESVDLWNNNPAVWWIVVEGKGEAEGGFALTVQCTTW